MAIKSLLLLSLIGISGCASTSGSIDVEPEQHVCTLEILGTSVKARVIPPSALPIAQDVVSAINRGTVRNWTSYDLGEVAKLATILIRQPEDSPRAVDFLLPTVNSVGVVLHFVAKGEQVELIESADYLLTGSEAP